MRRYLILALLLTGCARQAGPPPSVDDYRPARDDTLAVSFERPVSWSYRTAEHEGSQFLLLEATPRERLVISRLPAAAETRLAELDQRVREQIAEQFPGAESGPSEKTSLGGREALRCAFRIPSAETRGTRYVLAGGYVVETEARERYESTVQPVFDHVLSTLTFPE